MLISMVINGRMTKNEALAQAEEAYRKFFNIMAGLTRRQRSVVEKAIKKIEIQQMEKIRRRLNLS